MAVMEFPCISCPLGCPLKVETDEAGNVIRVTGNTCKPNPAYYAEILRNTGKQPQECLMVGNDAVEDTAALEQGIPVYLITDCLLNPQGRDLSGLPHGSFREFLAFAGLD